MCAAAMIAMEKQKNRLRYICSSIPCVRNAGAGTDDKKTDD